jgi:S-adenosylmethionine synthetase
MAKNVIGAKLARRCEVQVAYAIGVAEPVSLLVNTFGTGVVSDEKLALALRKTFDCRPGYIIEALNLLRPIYKQTAAYGHFGRSEKEFTWEQVDKADELAAAARSGNGVHLSSAASSPPSKKVAAKSARASGRPA